MGRSQDSRNGEGIDEGSALRRQGNLRASLAMLHRPADVQRMPVTNPPDPVPDGDHVFEPIDFGGLRHSFLQIARIKTVFLEP